MRWHTKIHANEFHAANPGQVIDFKSYLELETRLFNEVENEIESKLPVDQ